MRSVIGIENYNSLGRSALAKSIFLAGPTPREEEVQSWRPDAVDEFYKQKFVGTLYVPEGKILENYDDMVEWEDERLESCNCIMFWIPRELKKMPAFTTNIEWGRWESSGKVVLGAPEDAPKMGYIRYYARKHGVPQATTLAETVSLAIKMAEERCVRPY